MSWWSRYFSYPPEVVWSNLIGNESTRVGSPISIEDRRFALDVQQLDAWEMGPWADAWLAWFRSVKPRLADPHDTHFSFLQLDDLWETWEKAIRHQSIVPLQRWGSHLIDPSSNVVSWDALFHAFVRLRDAFCDDTSVLMYVALSDAILRSERYTDTTKKMAACILGMTMVNHAKHGSFPAQEKVRTCIQEIISPMMVANPDLIVYARLGMLFTCYEFGQQALYKRIDYIERCMAQLPALDMLSILPNRSDIVDHVRIFLETFDTSGYPEVDTRMLSCMMPLHVLSQSCSELLPKVSMLQQFDILVDMLISSDRCTSIPIDFEAF